MKLVNIAMLVLVVCLSNSSPAAFQKKTQKRNIPSGDTLLLRTPRGVVRVKNFFKTAQHVGDALVIMPAGSNYHLDYQRTDSSFLIQLMVLAKPKEASKARHQAEQQLLAQLGISQEDACKLDVRVIVPSARFSSEFEVGNYGLSFCPNSKRLPGEMASPHPPNNASSALPLTVQSKVSINSIGPIRVGMTIREASNVIQRALDGDNRGNPDCYHVRLKGGPDGLAFMVSYGRIARISISNTQIKTVEGARVGDTEAHIKSLYRNQVRISNHPYEEGGHYLTVIPRNPSLRSFRIVFETNGKRVTSYRVGKLPEVEFIEGCS